MLITEFMAGGDLFHALQSANADYYRWRRRCGVKPLFFVLTIGKHVRL